MTRQIVQVDQLARSGASDQQVLAWDETTGAWVPTTPAGGAAAPTGLDDLTDVDVTTSPPTGGQALVYSGTVWQPGTVPAPALDDLTDVAAATPADGQSLVYSSTASAWVPGDVGGGGGSGTESPTFTATHTTASLPTGGRELATIGLSARYRLLRIATDHPARVRIHTTAAKQAADAARPAGTAPTGDHGVMLDYVTTSTVLSADLSPVVDGFDGTTPPTGAVPLTVDNLDTTATPITVTLTWVDTSAGSVVLTSPDGSGWLLAVGDDGTLTTTPL